MTPLVKYDIEGDSYCSYEAADGEWVKAAEVEAHLSLIAVDHQETTERLRKELAERKALDREMVAAVRALADCPDWSTALARFNEGIAGPDDAYRAAWYKIALIAQRLMAQMEGSHDRPIP
jgi:hypothetical protein